MVKDLEQFLLDYPGMSTAPHLGSGLVLHGTFKFKASYDGGEEIEDAFKLVITVTGRYPQDLPKVEEVDEKIPRDGNFHVNPDGTLCLGSPLSLLKKIYTNKSLVSFTENCLVPYLYAVSIKLRSGGKFVFGELSHGDAGILEDYSVIFGLSEKEQVKKALQLLGLRKRIANKHQCPCGCGRRLGVCDFHYKVNKFRKMAPVSWFRGQRF